MNQRQQAFCEEYLKCGNAAESARKAGYSARTARSLGQRLLTNVDVAKYIQQRNEEINAASTAQIDEVRRFWSSIMRNEEEKSSERLRASELLGRSYGAFIEQFIIREKEERAEGGLRKETALHIEMLREYLKSLTLEQARVLAEAFKSDNEPIIYMPDNGCEVRR